MSDKEALIDLLKRHYPNLHFAYGKRFKYRFPNRVTLEKPPEISQNLVKIVQNPENQIYPPENFALQAFHELGHALCQHKDYTTDVSRLKIECAAWEAGKTAFFKLQKTEKSLKNLTWNDNLVEDSLDTYRNWLHQRSKCKKCGLTRYQTLDGTYHCPRCENFTQ